jgi:hypothetical protein
MKTPKHWPLVAAPVLLALVAGAASADDETPPGTQISWDPEPLVTEGIAPGEEQSYSVVLRNSGRLPILAAHQLRVVAWGAIKPYLRVTQPEFPRVLRPGQEVTFEVTVLLPEDAPVGVLDGRLALRRVFPNTLPVAIRVDGDTPVADQPLNDTGITLCGDYVPGGYGSESSNSLPCPVAGFPGQDAEYGRDVTHNDDSDGHAGFSFTKLDAEGDPLPADATAWSCVRDNVTGLIWEVKTDDGGLRDADNTYSWYNPDSGTNGGDAGTPNDGTCSGGIACDTYGFAQAVNAQGLCGANDWLLPNPRQLLSIARNDRIDPGIDTAYFPNSVPRFYWSSSPFAYLADSAWFVGLNVVGFYGKSFSSPVRLVRAGQ